MIRTALAVALAAVFGAVMIGPVDEYVQDQFLQPAGAISLGLVAAAAALVGIVILVLGRPSRFRTLEPRYETALGISLGSAEALRPAPPSCCSGVQPSYHAMAQAKLMLAKAAMLDARRRQLEPFAA